ncbi:MAG: type II toxin-antitoxin system Phd/YefM family antitoxin [Defluviitaleaceae bacterium]|nr:type II toxin-antitoxin system Phd/YefM family antitoxin [Defluviitaleaceae bacterium]
MVPVSRFNKGEAAKIFDEVSRAGIKIAVKNNKPACVLLSPEKYEAIMEELEDLELMMVAEKRLAEDSPTYSQDEVMQRLGITQSDIDAAEDVEIA